MSPNERLFKPEYAPEILSIAEADLKTAGRLAGFSDIRPENILFHVGQAIEKAIKAVLCAKSLAVPMTHDLEALVQALPEKARPMSERKLLAELSPFATVRRYEEGNYEITPEEIKGALLLAATTIKWASEVVRRRK